MTPQSQGIPSLALATGTERVAVAAPATHALARAFEDTLRLLFSPFHARRWIKLSFVCLFLGGGTPSAAFHWSLGSLPSETGFQDALEAARSYVSEHPWLMIVLIVLGLTMGLLMLYVRAIFRFVLVDGILQREVFVKQAWRAVRPLGRRYFLWLLGALLALGVVLATGTLLAYPILRASPPPGTRSLTSSLTLVGILAMEILMSLLVALLVMLTDDLVVPVMYVERLPLLAAWRKVGQRLREETGVFAVYVLLRVAAAVAIGLAVLFFLLPTLVGVFSGAVIAAALVVLALRLAGLAWVWNAFTLVLATLALLLLTGFLLVLLSVAAMPGQVLLQDFGLRFIASREPSLEVASSSPASPGVKHEATA